MNAVAEVVQEAVSVGKPKKLVKSGNLFADIASEVETLTKTKALNLADSLAENIDTNYFKLGGVLKVIYEQAWYDGYQDFDTFVADRFGFATRKAKYLMEIYENLVTKQVPWEKVSDLGWAKLKEIARFLSPENVDEWVEKVKNLTVSETIALLKANKGQEKPEKMVDDIQTIKFKLKGDQLGTVQSAINKAKAEAGTEFDNVALEMICTGYLGGSVSVTSIQQQMKAMGSEEVLKLFEQCWPDINLSVELPE